MKFLPQNKKKRILIYVILFFVALYIVDPFAPPAFDGMFMNAVGPPPEDPVERLAWLSENIDNMDHEKFVVIDEKLPSWKDLDKMYANLPTKRVYPQYIKATQTYGTLPNLVEALYFGDVLKDMGVNTQFIHANHWFKKGDFELWYRGYNDPSTLNQDESKRAIVHNILLAKQQGLAVILFPDYVELEDDGMNKLNISDDLEDRLETIALNLAEIAEKYGVEYLVPVNQIEMILETNGYTIEEAQQRTNAFYANVVPKMRKAYSGKILYKLGGFGSWDNYDPISLAGADIFGFTGCYNKNYNDFTFITNDTAALSAKADELSQKYGIPWIQAEFVIDDQSSERYSERDVVQTFPIEDYYEAGLNAFNNYGYNASGFTVHSLLGSGKVYDTPAMPIIKTFFNSKP